MSVTNVSSTAPAATSAATAKPAATNQTTQETTTQEQAYVVEKSETYATDYKKVEALKQNFNTSFDAFKKMVSALFLKQGGTANGFLDNLLDISDAGGPLRDQIAALEVDAETQAWAQQAVSEDGEWGANATAQRILDFAKAISGGDPSKIALLKDAFLKGYGQAADKWGGELPGVCGQTYDKVMEGFDAWEKEGQ